MDSSSTQPTFDFRRPTPSTPSHRSRTFVIVLALLAVVIGAVSVYLNIQERRAYEAYLMTPIGQLQMLEATSDPVTATDAERAAELSAMKKVDGQTTVSREDALANLKALSQ